MAYDETLAARVRASIGDHPALALKEMFGGIAYLIGGNMAVGVSKDELMVRVGKTGHDAAVARPGARIMDFTSRPMVGWVSVAREGFTDDADLDAWVDLGVSCASSLPPK
jgi:TfoX/Sxy family transcriptional regulator of competence genes